MTFRHKGIQEYSQSVDPDHFASHVIKIFKSLCELAFDGSKFLKQMTNIFMRFASEMIESHEVSVSIKNQKIVHEIL